MKSLMSRLWIAAKLAVGLVVLITIFRCTTMTNERAEKQSDATPANLQQPITKSMPCSAGDFVVKDVKTRHEYGNIIFTATVSNNSAAPCGIELKASTYDKSGAVLDTANFWPASVRNIAPGASENFKTALRYDREASDYDIVPINSKAWHQK